MTVIRKYAIQFVDYLLLTTCVLCFSSTNDQFGFIAFSKLQTLGYAGKGRSQLRVFVRIGCGMAGSMVGRTSAYPRPL